MCNSYRIKSKRSGAGDVDARLAEALGELPSSLVRMSDPGVVMRAGGRVEMMRWGFRRSFNPSINNARSDKLENGMWAEAFLERRCVIPMSLFYEWGPGAGGRKQAHEFRHPANDYLWAAGIWEHGGTGSLPCYSMVTTAASPLMAPVHTRMPALLRPDEVIGYLSASGSRELRPYAGPLVVAPCDSPLVKPGGGDSQPELF